MSSGLGVVGREGDVAAVVGDLASGPVVTVVGPGGIGKTTLAETVVATTTDRFETVVTIELTNVDEGDDVGNMLSRQLGHDSVEALQIALVDRPTLVVLDNCESALSVAQSLVADMTSASETVVILATSRVPLGSPGERVHVLEPLALPLAAGLESISDSPAVQLFIARARNAGATWKVGDAHLEAIAHIVNRLDGMPLAIELAAARARHLGPADLVDLLDRQLDVLQRPSDQGPTRHHSIRGAIYASYDPLDPDTKRLFRHLSLVRSGVDLEFVHRLNGVDDKLATLEMLSTLVEHSMVVAADDGGATTYRLLEPIRAYGLEQLDVMGETTSAEMQFIDAVAGFATDIGAMAMKSFSSEVLDRISTGSSLLLAALEAAIQHDETPNRAYRLYVPFYTPTPVARVELAVLGGRMLERWPEHTAPLQAEAVAVMAHSSMWAGDDSEAIARAEVALAHPKASWFAKMIAHRVRGFTAGLQADREAGVAHLEAAIEEAPDSGAFGRELRMSWASMLAAPDRSPEALATLEAAAASAAEQNEAVTLVWASIVAAHHHVALGDFDSATRASQRALEVSQQTGSPWATCAAHRVVASVTVLTDGWAASRQSWSRALENEIMVGDVEGMTLTLRTAAAAAHGAGEAKVAERLWGCVPPRRGVTALPPLFSEQEHALRARLGTPLPMTITESVGKARALLNPTTPAPVEVPAPEPEPPASAQIVRFDGFEVDFQAHELRSDGERVRIEPQVFEVLAYLAQRPGRMVPKEELLDEIWGDRFVSSSALSSRIKSARAATGDDGKTQRVIRTVHGRGFMFTAAVD
ncbi:MAG: winged helix-turn-helix domain-containing protein [Acidimicrobiales bacterium]